MQKDNRESSLTKRFPGKMKRLSRIAKYFDLKKSIWSGSTGLNNLDLELIKILGNRRKGFFVELGANDGIRQSNTYMLQKKFDWTGLLIEPNPARFVECVNNRSFKRTPRMVCAACVPDDFEERFVEMENLDLMGIACGLQVSEKEVKNHIQKGMQFLENPGLQYRYGAIARRLSELLDEINAPLDFDLLSVDVEGNELAVLRGLDLNRYKPLWILAETRDSKTTEYLRDYSYIIEQQLSSHQECADILYRYSP